MGFRAVLLSFSSFLFVAFGHPILGAAFGYALFWSVERRFWPAVGWFAAVQAVQLYWMTSTEYMGPFILVVYAFLCIAMGLQFGLLTSLIRLPLDWRQILGLSGFWVLMEWSRLYFLTGFTWNPIGLALAGGDSIQFASLFGIYGLCFWVIFTNLLALAKKPIWAVVALVPYLFSLGTETKIHKKISVALVQTNLRPEQRDLMRGYEEDYIHPLDQWKRLVSFLQETGQSKFDLIVFPECALPSYRSNAEWMQNIADHFGAEVIVGLDAKDGAKKFNAAFHFTPGGKKMDRYEKRILIPVGEYIPFSGVFGEFFANQFGIVGSFDAGLSAKVFQGDLPLGICICLEETYSHLVREIRQSGAELLISISNDVWFPNTRLPEHHFAHGRIRAAENGVCLLRACNTGVTAAVDCFGRTIQIFAGNAGVLTLDIPVRSRSTPYTFWGDWPILAISAGSFFFMGLFRFRKKKLPEYSSLD